MSKHKKNKAKRELLQTLKIKTVLYLRMTKECGSKPSMNIKITIMDITDFLYMAILVAQWHIVSVCAQT